MSADLGENSLPHTVRQVAMLQDLQQTFVTPSNRKMDKRG